MVPPSIEARAPRFADSTAWRRITGLSMYAKTSFVRLALVVVRVHVYDEKILVVALARLPRGMLKVLRGRIVLGGELAHFAAGHVHGRLLLGFWRDAPCTVPKRRRRYRRRAGRRRTFSTAVAGRRAIRRFAARIHNRATGKRNGPRPRTSGPDRCGPARSRRPRG